MPQPTEVFKDLQPVNLSVFGEFFSTFRQEAFRFEMLSSYTVPNETPYLAQYREGKVCPDEFNSDWLALVGNAVSNGKTLTRVRYIPDSGLNTYIRFEIDWGYKRSSQRGENILILNNISLDNLANAIPVLNDFWLFDRTHCFLMFYDGIGRFLGVQKIPTSANGLYVSFADSLIAKATPIMKSGYFR